MFINYGQKSYCHFHFVLFVHAPVSPVSPPSLLFVQLSLGNSRTVLDPMLSLTDSNAWQWSMLEMENILEDKPFDQALRYVWSDLINRNN